MPAADFGCNTYGYMRLYRAEACVTRLIDLGFREFELMVHPQHLWPGVDEAAKLRRTVEAAGARIVTLNMPNIDINVAGESEEMRRYSLDLVSRSVQLAGEVGAPGIVIGPGKANPLFPAPLEQLTGYFFAALDVLAPLAKKSGTALWAENMPFAYLPGIDALCGALDRYGDPSIGITYDVANAWFIGEDLRHGLARSGRRLKIVHLSDTNRQVYRHDPVGLGNVPFRDVSVLLRETGYRERPMLEIISANPDADIMDSVSKLDALGFGAKR